MTVEIRSSEDRDLLPDAHEIRRVVFIDEQGVPESVEMDDKDDESIHLVAYEGDEPVGTARVRQVDPEACRVERVAVLKKYRDRGIGAELMRRAEEVIAELGAEKSVVHAQLRVEGFYDELGYERTSGEYEEAGIPHVTMEKGV